MIVLTLGTMASGSTWVFNVVRHLFARSNLNAVSTFGSNLKDLLEAIPFDCEHVIVKSHNVDKTFLKLASICDVRVITTTRDPRDSCVSLRNRIGVISSEVARELSRTTACLGSIPSHIPSIHFNYEDDFTSNEESISRIASFLKLPINPSIVEEVSTELSRNAVRTKIEQLNADGRLSDTGYDSMTLWHANHVGDGAVGKWETLLPSGDQEVVTGAVGSPRPGNYHQERLWMSDLFLPEIDHYSPGSARSVRATGDDQCLLWGPYLYLPSGLWKATPLIKPSRPSGSVGLRADIFSVTHGRGVLAAGILHLPSAGSESLCFDHFDHTDPLEFRISGLADGREANFLFEGVKLVRLGDSDRQEMDAGRVTRLGREQVSSHTADKRRRST